MLTINQIWLFMVNFFLSSHGQYITYRTTSYYGEPLTLACEGTGLTFPMQSCHQTLQIPVHHQGFKIFVHNSTTFNQSIIDIWNATVPNDTINSFMGQDVQYVKYPGIYEHLEGDIIHQPGDNECLYAHHHHTRLVPYGGENQFVIFNILPQFLWNKLIDTQWRWIWKRKDPWYDAWKNAEMQRASASPVSGLVPAHWVRRSIHTIHQARAREACSY